MLKHIITASAIAAALIFSGCGSADSEGEARLDAQYAIDQGDYATAIAILEAKVVKTDEDYLQLASAYMGLAGFSFTELVAKVNASSNDVSGDAFKSFVLSAATNVGAQTQTNLDKAIAAYLSISTVSPAPALAPALVLSNDLASLKDDVKLYLGLAYIVKTAVIIDTLNVQADVTQEIVDFLNDGLDVVEYIAPDDLKTDIQEFRTEIDADVNGVISIAELQNYLVAEGFII